MEARTIDDCFKFRMLKRIESNSEKSQKSMEIARFNLKEAEYVSKQPDEHFFKYLILSSYLAIFHAARAVLYKDGIQEKSHYAIYVYLKEKYSKVTPLSVLNLFNIHRIERHEAMYGLEYKPDEEDCDVALRDAKIFVKAMEDLLRR